MQPTRLRGARTNNLAGIDLDLEPGTLVAITGPSGAGKSSLAFGTLYAEGQRRYVESFSAYARQFLERQARPPVDELEPVPAAVAVDRQAPVRTSRSTVGTMTEIYDYARGLWARAATLVCPGCGRTVKPDDPGSAAAEVLSRVPGDKIVITFPVPVPDADALASARMELLPQGYGRVLVDGAVRELADLNEAEILAIGHLDVIADRAVATPGSRARLVESLEAAMRRGGGRADVVSSGERLRFSTSLHCPHCDKHFRPVSPGLLSFNSPIGACPACRGFGRIIGVDMAKVIPDPSLSLGRGAIRPWQGKKTVWERRELKSQCKRAGVPWDAPVSSFTEAQRRWLLDGDDGGWWGLGEWFSWLESKAYKLHVRVLLSRYRSYDECPSCQGTRLVAEASMWRLGGAGMAGFWPCRRARRWPSSSSAARSSPMTPRSWCWCASASPGCARSAMWAWSISLSIARRAP